MTDYIDAAPSGWNYRVSLFGVFCDCALVNESFELPINGKVHHWGQDFSFGSPLEVAVEACREAEYVTLNISVASSVSVACSRCLERGEAAINGNLRYLVSFRPELETGEEETAREGKVPGEEMIFVSSPNETINIGELAWEVLITALPPVVLCSGSCLGLCPECGANLNKAKCSCREGTADPRFEALQGLFEDDKD